MTPMHGGGIWILKCPPLPTKAVIMKDLPHAEVMLCLFVFYVISTPGQSQDAPWLISKPRYRNCRLKMLSPSTKSEPGAGAFELRSVY